MPRLSSRDDTEADAEQFKREQLARGQEFSRPQINDHPELDARALITNLLKGDKYAIDSNRE